MDASKIALEITKANAKRKINWIIFGVGLVMFIASYMYLKKANYKISSISAGNPFAVSYAEAFNSKQLDTIQSVPNFRRLAPFTPSTTPVSNRMFLGATLSNDYFIYFNPAESSNRLLFETLSNSIYVQNNLSSMTYHIDPAVLEKQNWIWYKKAQVWFQKINSNIFTISGFVPYTLTSGYGGVVVYNDLDIVLDGVPSTPVLVPWESNVIPPLIDSSLIAPVHATSWYSNALSPSNFYTALSNGLPNSNAGRELVVGDGNLSQIPFRALNHVFVLTSSDFTASNISFSRTSLTSDPSFSLPTTGAHSRSYYLRNPDNLTDGTCASFVGIDVQSSKLHPSTKRNTWIVLNGTWTVLPEFVFFDSANKENPMILNIQSNAANIPITLANLAHRWLVMSTKLTTNPTIVEPSFDFLTSNLGIPLNAFGRQGMTVMSSTNLSTSVLPYRTILSVKGDTSNKYYWFVMYSAWIAGFVGQSFITDITGYSNYAWTNVGADLTATLAMADLTKTFLYVMISSQAKLNICSRTTSYSFILVVVGSQNNFSGDQSIQIFRDNASLVETLTNTLNDTVDPNSTHSNSFWGLTPQYWPTASVSYLIKVAGHATTSPITVSPPFGYSKSFINSI